MDHNEFDFIDDLIQPFYYFLKQCNISVEVEEDKKGTIEFKEELYIPPSDFPTQNNNSNLWNWILRKFMWKCHYLIGLIIFNILTIYHLKKQDKLYFI